MDGEMPRQRLGAISPYFVVTDVPRSIWFYEERLGFEVRYAEPSDKPFFAIVGRDGVQLFLKSEAAVSAAPNKTRAKSVPWDAFIHVQAPDALAAEFTARGLMFYRDVADRSDGLRGFETIDEDGYVLFFGCPIPELAPGQESSR